MKYRLGYLSVIAILATGCSSNDNTRQALGSFDYANKAEAKLITIPENLEKPKFSNDYKITDKISYAGAVGEKLDVRAPSLVLPIAAGARVDIKDQGTQVWFDQVLEDRPLIDFIKQAVNAEVADRNSRIIQGTSDNVLTTDWVAYTREEGMWWWKHDKLINRKKFQFTLTPKTHGRSVAVKIALVDYEGDQPLDPIDKQRAEVTMLNEVVGQVDYQYRLHQHEKRELRANQKLVSLGEDSQHKPAYIVEMALDDLWSNLPVFFEHYGFTVTDLDEGKHIYYVDYKQPENGFWSSMWGETKPVLDMVDGKYQFRLRRKDDFTSVTISDEQGEFTQAKLQALFADIEPGLSFRTAINE